MCRGTISFANGAIEVEATVIAEALDLPPEALMTMVRSGQITSLCERGVDADEGRYRLPSFTKASVCALLWMGVARLSDDQALISAIVLCQLSYTDQVNSLN